MTLAVFINISIRSPEKHNDATKTRNISDDLQRRFVNTKCYEWNENRQTENKKKMNTSCAELINNNK